MSRYTEAAERAERISKAIIQRARKAAQDAGLDPELLGIHPHNAMVSFNQGRPWPNVDYSKVRLCLRLIERSYVPSSIVDRWCKRIYKELGNYEGYKYLHK